MNVISDTQPLIRSTSEHKVNTADHTPVKGPTKQQKINNVDATTQSVRKTDTIQISKTGLELNRASNTTSSQDSMKPSTDMRADEKRISSIAIESVMTRYREAQIFLSQIESGSINSIA